MPPVRRRPFLERPGRALEIAARSHPAPFQGAQIFWIRSGGIAALSPRLMSCAPSGRGR